MSVYLVSFSRSVYSKPEYATIKANTAQDAVSEVRFNPKYECYEVFEVFKKIKNWS